MRKLLAPHPVDGGGEVHADRALSTRNAGKPNAGLDDVKFALDMDLLALIDERHRGVGTIPTWTFREIDVCGLGRAMIPSPATGRETFAKRRQLVWDVEKKLAEDVARPIISQGVADLCRQPYVKSCVLQQRFDDMCLDM
jgi:hypothetical protein